MRSRLAGYRLFLAGLALTAASSCRDEQAGPRPKPTAPGAQAHPQLLERAPEELTFRSGATWAHGAVIYLGSRVSFSPPGPRQSATLAHYFQAVQQPPSGFRFFVHVVDAASGQMLLNADHEVQGGALPLASWPVGQTVQDQHTVLLPLANGRQLRVLLGFWQDDRRLPVDQAEAHDGQNRMLGPMLVPPSPSLPEYRVQRTPKPPVIDGLLTDEVWRLAAPAELVGSLDGAPTSLRTVARLLYDDRNLYLSFDCEDPDVWGTMLKRDDPIYTEEVVEIFIDANADGRTYNEIEVSPNNTVFDAYFPERRHGMDLSWDSGLKSAVKVRGTLNDPSDRDQGWSVEMQIPIARLAEVPRVPPRRGDRWRFNLYRLEHVDRKRVEGQAFSPLFIGDFHHLPRFGWLIFE
ncbi:MAG TPA: carbohydrate-binding family 9-like protein [Myxococcaceae bacterium]|nr:carbohydrate-binding family 9-like protein [Myxococcaceae bacterium]